MRCLLRFPFPKIYILSFLVSIHQKAEDDSPTVFSHFRRAVSARGISYFKPLKRFIASLIPLFTHTSKASLADAIEV